jgi:hypothetical protein
MVTEGVNPPEQTTNTTWLRLIGQLRNFRKVTLCTWMSPNLMMRFGKPLWCQCALGRRAVLRWLCHGWPERLWMLRAHPCGMQRLSKHMVARPASMMT